MMRSIVLLLVIATGVFAKTKTATIRYKRGTMGITTENHNRQTGWKITFIHPVEPGQPNLNVGDRITGIAGISFLGMEIEEQEDIFDRYIEDGVEMDVEPVQDRYASRNGGRRYTAQHHSCAHPHCLEEGWQEHMQVNGATCCEAPTPPTDMARYSFRSRVKALWPEYTGNVEYGSAAFTPLQTCGNTTGPKGVHDFEGTVSRWWEHRDGEQRTNYKPSHPENWHRGPWAWSTRHNYEPQQQLKQGAKKPRRRNPSRIKPYPENCCHNPVEREDGLCKNNWVYKTVPDKTRRAGKRRAVTSENEFIQVHHKFRKGRPTLQDEREQEAPWYQFWGNKQ